MRLRGSLRRTDASQPLSPAGLHAAPSMHASRLLGHRRSPPPPRVATDASGGMGRWELQRERLDRQDGIGMGLPDLPGTGRRLARLPCACHCGRQRQAPAALTSFLVLLNRPPRPWLATRPGRAHQSARPLLLLFGPRHGPRHGSRH